MSDLVIESISHSLPLTLEVWERLLRSCDEVMKALFSTGRFNEKALTTTVCFVDQVR